MRTLLVTTDHIAMVPIRKRLRRLHRLLVNSRYALEEASRRAPAQWMRDLLFTLSCRRIIMLNELDRELGQFHVPIRPEVDPELYFGDLSIGSAGAAEYVEVCQAEESFLQCELENLKLESGLQGHTRDAISSLLAEIRANMRDILFLRENHPALQH